MKNAICFRFPNPAASLKCTKPDFERNYISAGKGLHAFFRIHSHVVGPENGRCLTFNHSRMTPYNSVLVGAGAGTYNCQARKRRNASPFAFCKK